VLMLIVLTMKRKYDKKNTNQMSQWRIKYNM
jgi:hypothetical protein